MREEEGEDSGRGVGGGGAEGGARGGAGTHSGDGGLGVVDRGSEVRVSAVREEKANEGFIVTGDNCTVRWRLSNNSTIVAFS